MPPRPDVPYSPVATVAPEVQSPEDYLRVQATPQAFGSQIGEAEERAGATGQQLGDKTAALALQFQQMQGATNALNAGSGYSREVGTAETQFRMLSGNNAVAAYPAFQKQLQDIQQKYLDQLHGPMERLAFLRDTRSVAERSLINAGLHVGEQAKVAHIQALQASIKEEQSNVVRFTMTGQQPDYTGLINKTLMLAHEQGLDQESATALVQNTTGEAMRDMIVARVAQGDTKGASKLLSEALTAKAPGTDLPLLDANHQASLSQFIQQKEYLDSNRALTNQMRNMAYQEKVKRDAAEEAGDRIVSQLLTDPSSVDLKEIADDPNLTFEQKWSLHNMVNAALSRDTDTKDTETYGSGFFDALKEINAPDNDPERITDPKQLWDRAGPNGDLTVAGVKELQSVLAGRGTPDGAANSKLQAGALAYAKHQISFAADYGSFKLRDPKGEDAFNVGFLPAFMKYWNDGLKSGKTPYELSNKEELDKLIAPFKRSQPDLVKDKIEAGFDVPQGAIPQAHDGAAIDTSTAQSVVQAYLSGRLSRADAEKIALEKGFIQKPADTGPEPPIAR